MSYGINRLLRRFIRSRKGNIAIITGLALPVVIGFCGFATETAYWYYRQRDVQGAADLAAFGGAIVLRGGGTRDQIVTASTNDAVTNGWRQASGTITINTPPTSGGYQNDNSVEVILTEQEDRYFTQIYYGSTKVMVTSRAIVTHTPAGPACFLGLDKQKPGTVEFWGNSTAAFTACNVASNSTNVAGFGVGGSANVMVPCVSSAGGSVTDSGLTLTSCGSVATYQLPIPDPYATVPPPTWSSCQVLTTAQINSLTDLGTDGATTCYSGVPFVATPIHTSVRLHGTVVISGGSFRTNGSSGNLNGTDVMLYLTNNATINMNGNGTWDLTAKTTGDYAGLVIFSDRNNAFATNIINGTSSSRITGAIYTPSMETDFLGNFTGRDGCMQLVSDVIYYTGNGTFSNDCSTYGTKTIKVPGLLTLVE